jgi:hypothetical protein
MRAVNVISFQLSTACMAQCASRSMLTKARAHCGQRRSAYGSSCSTSSRRDTLALLGIPAAATAALPDAGIAADKDFEDDPELVRKAREQRQQRVQEEFNREQEFTQSEGATRKARTRATGTVQTAINQLSRTGDALEKGDLQTVSQLLACAHHLSRIHLPALGCVCTFPQRSMLAPPRPENDWNKRLQQTINITSSSSASSGEESTSSSSGSNSGEQVLSTLSSVAEAANANDLQGAKRAYVSTVSALQDWCKEKGFLESVRGI